MSAIPAAPAGYHTVDGGVATDLQGNPVWYDDFGQRISYQVFDSRDGQSPVTDLISVATGSAVSVVMPLSDAEATSKADRGRILVYVPDSLPLVWFDRGDGYRWPSVPLEQWADIAGATTSASDATKAAQDAADSAAAAANSASIATATQAQQDQLMSTAATMDDLIAVSRIDGAWSGGTWSGQPPAGFIYTMFVAPFPCEILSATLATDLWSSSSTTANYWTLTLRSGTTSKTFSDIVSKTTHPTSGQAIVAREPWNMGGGAWNTTAATLAQGDLVVLYLNPTGSPSAVKLPLTLSLRYQPVRDA